MARQFLGARIAGREVKGMARGLLGARHGARSGLEAWCEVCWARGMARGLVGVGSLGGGSLGARIG